MSHLYSIFVKIYVREFYRQHAVLFIMALAILGGFMSGREHMALASFFVSTPSATLFPFILWVAYLLKVIGFFRQAVHKKENEFAYHFILFSRSTQATLLASVWLSMLLPVLVYGVFLIFIAFRVQQEVTMMLILFYMALLVIAGLLFAQRLLNNPNPERTPGYLKQWIDKHIYKPYGVVLAESILRNQVVTFLVIKAGIIALLLSVLFLYTTEPYDLRLLAMTTVIAFAGASPFMYAIQQFEDAELSWVRNLPWSLLKRMGYRFLCIGILCFPEVAILAGRFPANLLVTDFILILLLSVSQLVLYHGGMYIRGMNLDRFNRFLFYITIIEVVLVLFNTPVIILTLINLSSGVFLYRYFYYR